MTWAIKCVLAHHIHIYTCTWHYKNNQLWDLEHAIQAHQNSIPRTAKTYHECTLGKCQTSHKKMCVVCTHKYYTHILIIYHMWHIIADKIIEYVINPETPLLPPLGWTEKRNSCREIALWSWHVCVWMRVRVFEYIILVCEFMSLLLGWTQESPTLQRSSFVMTTHMRVNVCRYVFQCMHIHILHMYKSLYTHVYACRRGRIAQL